MKEETKEFLRSWLLWVERGAPGGDPYHRRHGLCASIDEYVEMYDRKEAWRDIYLDLQTTWRQEGLDKVYPFGKAAYDHAVSRRIMHEDGWRLAWVREHVQ